MPYPIRLRLATLLAQLARPLAGLFDRIGLKPMAAALRLAPRSKPDPMTAAGVYPSQGPRRGRVALLSTCANEALAPQITQSAIRVLNRHGIEVVIPKGEGCCGSLLHHIGRDEPALAQARNNIDVWTREIEQEGLDAILITISGCGTTIKDYGFMLRTDPAYAAKAERVAGLTRDVSEYLATLPIKRSKRGKGLTVAYHSACALQHGQRIHREPKDLLSACGFTVKEVPEGHLCCGSAGTYNILQPDIAERLRERKVANIERTGADIIAAGNIGCITQIAPATKLPIVHSVQLIDWATGGPMPEAMERASAARWVANADT
jgi:glycolate oxidase iron-sulfur subunit